MTAISVRRRQPDSDLLTTEISSASIELRLMALATGAAALAYLIASTSMKSTMLPGSTFYLGVVLAALWVGHGARRWLAPAADPILYPSAALLTGLAYVFQLRVAAELAPIRMKYAVRALVTELQEPARPGGEFRRNAQRFLLEGWTEQVGTTTVQHTFLGRANRAFADAATIAHLPLKQMQGSILAVAAFCAILALVRFRIQKDERPDSRLGYAIASRKLTIGLVGVVLLMLPMVPGLGRTINGSRIWISFGPIPSIQPGELAKVALVLFLAGFLAERTSIEKLPITAPQSLSTTIPLVAIWAVAMVVIVVEKDFGLALLLFSLFVIMVWVRSGQSSVLWLAGGLFAGGVALLTVLGQLPVVGRQVDHLGKRVDEWLHPDPAGQLSLGYQHLAAGGVSGNGMGRGLANGLPEVQNDMLIALIGDELGLIGVTVVLSCYLLVSTVGLRAAARSTDDVERLVAVGLSATFVAQSFILLGGVARLIPLTGVVLPFVSTGISGLLVNFAIMALLITVSQNSERDRVLARGRARA